MLLAPVWPRRSRRGCPRWGQRQRTRGLQGHELGPVQVWLEMEGVGEQSPSQADVTWEVFARKSVGFLILMQPEANQGGVGLP